MTSDRLLRVHGALLVTAVLFSANYIVSKMAMAVFAPLTFAWLRVAGSALLLNAIVGPVRLERDDRRRITRIAILGVVINQTLFLGGLSLTSAHVAAILITTIPVFALGAAMVHKLERATVHKVAGLGLACFGALLVVGGEQFEGSARSVLGALMIIANCLSYAIYLVIARPLLQRIAPIAVMARMFAAGTVMMLPISAWSLAREEWSAIPAGAWFSLLLVILGPTVGAYLLNAWALRHAESSLVAAYVYVQPVLATILASIYLSEQLHWIVAVAAGLIFIGVAIAGRAPGPIAE